MPDRVDAPVHRVKDAAGDPVLNGLEGQTEVEQLRERNHPVLPGGELGDRQVDWPDATNTKLLPYMGDNFAFGGHAAQGAAAGVTCGAVCVPAVCL
jgi:hypothetical protein